MSDIDIFTSGDGTQEARCTVTVSNGGASASVSKTCLAKNAGDCLKELTAEMPGASSKDLKRLVAETES
jgi:hypothetical protein